MADRNHFEHSTLSVGTVVSKAFVWSKIGEGSDHKTQNYIVQSANFLEYTTVLSTASFRFSDVKKLYYEVIW